MKTILVVISLLLSAFISKAQTVSALADSAFAQKRYGKAFELYSDIVKADPANLKALRRRAFCIMNSGSELNATHFFSEALKVDPKDPASNYYMGVVFMDAAKDPAHATEKAHFKAQASIYLKKAADYGSNDAKGAMEKLNGI